LSTNSVAATTISNDDGFFQFEGAFAPDRYVLRGTAPEKYLVLNADGGVTANDAALLNRWIVDRPSMPFRTPGVSHWTQKTMMYVAGNVDENRFVPYDYFGIDANDVQQIMNATVQNFRFPRSVNIGGSTYATGSFHRTHPDDANTLIAVDDWKFSNDTIDLTRHEEEIHMFAVMMGDADLSYFPEGGHADDLLRRRTAAQRNPNFDLFDTIFVNSRDQFINYPILAMQDGEVGAMQLWMQIPDDLEVLNITPGVRGDMRLTQNIYGNRVLFSWITNSGQPITFREGDVIVNLVMKVNRSGARAMRQIPTGFTFDPTGYGAWNGQGGNITRNFRVALPTIVIDNDLPITILDSIIGEEEIFVEDTVRRPDSENLSTGGAEIQNSKIINVIPNPMSDRADVTYSISEDAMVSLRLLNLLGVEIRTLIAGEQQEVGVFRHQITAEGLPNGVYILRLETISHGRRDVSIEKVVVNR
jgi:hypothetical protein